MITWITLYACGVLYLKLEMTNKFPLQQCSVPSEPDSSEAAFFAAVNGAPSVDLTELLIPPSVYVWMNWLTQVVNGLISQYT